MKRKAHALRQVLYSPKVDFALEAHNGISAKIVEEAGFPVIWGSGLTVSSSLGHRDCNEISWTNLCDQIEYMIDGTSIPLLLDGDSGFGNFNNVRQLVRKLCKYNVGGVCLEDKLFPKTNSFLPYHQTLAPVDEFVGKIKAAKDTQTDEAFCVVARIEAFIAGLGLDEAIERAYAYKEAGADALMIHSKQSSPVEIKQFCEVWDGSIPIVIAPTTYAPSNPEVYKQLNVSLVIWSNQLLRVSIKAMRGFAKSLFETQTPHAIHSEMASLQDIFNLVEQEELERAEEKYAPCKPSQIS